MPNYNKIDQDFKKLPKWRNFAKSGHNELNEIRPPNSVTGLANFNNLKFYAEFMLNLAKLRAYIGNFLKKWAIPGLFLVIFVLFTFQFK